MAGVLTEERVRRQEAGGEVMGMMGLRRQEAEVPGRRPGSLAKGYSGCLESIVLALWAQEARIGLLEGKRAAPYPPGVFKGAHECPVANPVGSFRELQLSPAALTYW